MLETAKRKQHCKFGDIQQLVAKKRWSVENQANQAPLSLPLLYFPVENRRSSPKHASPRAGHISDVM